MGFMLIQQLCFFENKVLLIIGYFSVLKMYTCKMEQGVTIMHMFAGMDIATKEMSYAKDCLGMVR